MFDGNVKLGKYLCYEGADYSGKSTMAAMTQTWLTELGIKSIVAPQPGATELGRKIRAIVKHDKDITLGLETEALMFVLDHMSFVESVLDQQLSNGTWVISDRHNYISGLVYQVLRGVAPDRLRSFYSIFGNTPKVDALLILKAPIEVLAERAAKRNDERWDRYENDDEFTRNVVTAYDQFFDTHGSRMVDVINADSELPHPACRYVDASGSLEEVFDRIKTVLGMQGK